MKSFNRIVSLSMIFLLMSGATASALRYQINSPLLFTYQNDAGWWFGCGPTQCTYSGDRTEEKAKNYLAQDWHGPFYFIGWYGRCKVYSGQGSLRASDNTPDTIMQNFVDGKC